MRVLKDRLFLIIASVSILIIALSVSYYFVVFLPAKEKTKQEQVNRELGLKQAEQEAKQKELQVFKDCDTEAIEKAKELLRKKGIIGDAPSNWEKAEEQGLYLKDDYNRLYENCLRRHGIKY